MRPRVMLLKSLVFSIGFMVISLASHASQECDQLSRYVESSAKPSPDIFLSDHTQVLFVGENHSDVKSKNNYEYILNQFLGHTQEQGCLFLEADESSQAIFDSIIPGVNEEEILDRLVKFWGIEHEIESKDRFRSWVQTASAASKMNIKVFAFDQSIEGQDPIVYQLSLRNDFMAKNIIEKFSNRTCSKAMVINGMAHLYLKSTLSFLSDKPVIIPIPEQIKIKGLSSKTLFLSSDMKFVNELFNDCFTQSPDWPDRFKNKVFLNGHTHSKILFSKKYLNRNLSPAGADVFVVDDSVGFLFDL